MHLNKQSINYDIFNFLEYIFENTYFARYMKSIINVINIYYSKIFPSCTNEIRLILCCRIALDDASSRAVEMRYAREAQSTS